MSDIAPLEADLHPWFERWEVKDRSVFADWCGSMRKLRVEPQDILVSAGDRARHIYLVQSGLLRLYYTTLDGKERNKAFYGKGEITGAVSAAMTGGPAPFSIQALEPAEVIQADFSTLSALAHPDASELFIRLLSRAFIRNEQREALFLTCNAEQRYRDLLESNPELVERLPQFHIASYLGVDAVSLSRLKNKLEQEAGGA